MDTVLPGWLCGRLAALYRTLERYDDEVALLERYRDSQHTEEARVRYDARLSKARTIAERKRRRDSGAVISVRRVIARPRPQRTSTRTVAVTTRSGFTPTALSALYRAVENETQFPGLLQEALSGLCAEAHEHDQPFEEIITTLKQAYGDRSAGDSRYDAALLHVLSLYFERV